VAVEVALALILLTGAGLLSRSVIRLHGVASGMEADGLALVQVRLLPSYDENEERRAFFSELSHGLAALPGVTSVSHIADPPMGFNQWSPSVWREEDVVRGEEAGSGNAHRVGRDYFRTMGIPLRLGRVFTGGDQEGSPRVAVVSQSMAEALWPDEDPLGKRLGLSVDHEGPWVTVVGVVGDIRQGSLRSRPGRDIYLPFAQDPGDQSAYMVVRTTGAPLALTQAFRQAVWALDGNVPVPEVTTMKARVDATLKLPRFRALLLACFAGTALILAAAGIYGTLGYTVGRRTSEVGIRMALGARAGDVVATLVRQGMTSVVVGVGLGLGGAFSLTRVLESVLFETSPTDPWTFGLVAGVLVGVSLCASFLPARRASRIHPREALRAD
jgi:predicted permease